MARVTVEDCVDKRGRSRGKFVEQRVWSIYRAAPKCE